MSDDRIALLLDELMESDSTPEAVCRSCPELLPEIRKRWRRMEQMRAELDALLPSHAETTDFAVRSWSEANLPQIPGYEVQAVLGRGGMGIVFRVRQQSLNRIVAMKVAIAGAYASRLDRNRFQREAEAVAVLKHPNIVQIYDVGTADNLPYFTMEYVEGGTLAQKLGGIPLPMREAASLLATLATAVESAHVRGIVHRDLKPSNILLTAEGTPKISDFGLARRFDDLEGLTRTGAAVGTPSYMAPEQAQGTSGQMGPAVDIYALGAILYEMLTGRPPFQAESAAKTIQQLLVQDPAPPSQLNSNVPKDLETICLKCLRKDPRQRYESAAQLADDLQRFLGGESILARPEGPVARVVRRIRRRPVESALMAGVALLTVALVLGGAEYWAERAAAEREAGAELLATQSTVEADLQEMVAALESSSWAAARTAAGRARARLGMRDLPELRARLEQGEKDLDLVARLDAIRLAGMELNGGVLRTNEFMEMYSAAFRDAGLGSMDEPTGQMAERIASSRIRKPLLEALDHWSVFLEAGSAREQWLLEVARKADPDPTGWRTRARDPAVRKDDAAIVRLVNEPEADYQSVSLMLALERALSGTNPEHVPLLQRLYFENPDDFWVNFRLGNVLYQFRQLPDAAAHYRAALAIRPDAASACNNLGGTLSDLGRHEEGLQYFRRAVTLDPKSSRIQTNLAIGVWNTRRLDDAQIELAKAIRMDPQRAQLHTAYAGTLEAKGQLDEALEKHRTAVAVDPQSEEAQRDFRRFLLRHKKFDVLHTEWQKSIAANPSNHDFYYGYAEYCLYRGDLEAYRQARQTLLMNFHTPTTAQIAERTARTVLLAPASDEETKTAASLALIVGSMSRTQVGGVYPHFQFVYGLAEYRCGRFDKAIEILRGDGANVLQPAPQLVLAMAEHRRGNTELAREQLSAAVKSYNWKGPADEHDAWIIHVLRREADQVIGGEGEEQPSP